MIIMRRTTIPKWAVIIACVIGLSATALAKGGRGGGGGMGRGGGFGNSGFGRTQMSQPKFGRANSGFGRKAAKANDRRNAKMTRKAKKTNRGARSRGDTLRGNSAFGRKQGDPTTRTTGSQNSAFGQKRAAEARARNANSITGNGSDQTGPGNSEFGHRQGDAETRTTGSQNSAFGQNRAAEAKASPRPSPDGQ
jgi:hypothetical protein